MEEFEYLNLTKTDLLNAGLFASQAVKKYRYDTQKIESRWSLPPYELVSRPFNDEFYVPDELKKDFKIYSYKFREESCKEMTCFFYMGGNSTCPNKLNDRVYTKAKIGDITYNICQDACYQNQTTYHPFELETYYKDDTCFMRNAFFKRYCIFPRSRLDKLTAIPHFDYNEQTGDCFINEKYCKRFGMEFTAGDSSCYITEVQENVENYFSGKNLYRLIKLAFQDQDEEEIVFMKAKMQDKSGFDADQFMLSILYDIGIDTSFKIMQQVSLKALPLLNKMVAEALITQIQTRASVSFARAAVSSMILQTCNQYLTARVVLSISTAISSAGSVAGFGQLIVGILGLILDIVDPLELKAQITQDHLRMIKEAFQYAFDRDVKYKLVCDPEMYILRVSKGLYSTAEQQILVNETLRYLQHLQRNSIGEPVKKQASGITVEQIINEILSVFMKLENEQQVKLKSKMDKYFTKFSLFCSVLIPVFLAISM